MEKIIKIDDSTEIRLSNNVGWLMEYQDQFGHDIVPDLMPVLGAVLELIEGMGGTISVKDARDLVKGIPAGAAGSALVELSGLRMTDIINIVWALAKAADPNIDPPRQWVRQFDTFPLDVIVPEVFMLVAQGVMSSKNWTRLQRAAKDLQAPGRKGQD